MYRLRGCAWSSNDHLSLIQTHVCIPWWSYHSLDRYPLVLLLPVQGKHHSAAADKLRISNRFLLRNMQGSSQKKIEEGWWFLDQSILFNFCGFNTFFWPHHREFALERGVLPPPLLLWREPWYANQQIRHCTNPFTTIYSNLPWGVHRTRFSWDLKVLYKIDISQRLSPHLGAFPGTITMTITSKSSRENFSPHLHTTRSSLISFWQLLSL